ncbi:hypothetical protein VTK73DRAFT_2121 [Phialemonium thermophilum]|uniref:Uncharacterized protein n=1 Tax=Phialemonium thermophilum TaxID=223376 RepID=A0ABR3X656_9PEZI
MTNRIINQHISVGASGQSTERLTFSYYSQSSITRDAELVNPESDHDIVLVQTTEFLARGICPEEAGNVRLQGLHGNQKPQQLLVKQQWPGLVLWSTMAVWQSSGKAEQRNRILVMSRYPYLGLWCRHLGAEGGPRNFCVLRLVAIFGESISPTSSDMKTGSGAIVAGAKVDGARQGSPAARRLNSFSLQFTTKKPNVTFTLSGVHL